MVEWILQEGVRADEVSERMAAQELGARRRGKLHSYAVTLNEVVIHDNRKWFGEADVRVDALVVQGVAPGDSVESCYGPGTFRFSRIRDGERLPIGESGLLVFMGKPRYFLDLFITVSRDASDSEDLAKLLGDRVGSRSLSEALGGLSELAAGGITAAAMTAGIRAATELGNLAYRILRDVTSDTIGLYRASWLQHRDGFGEGRHPPQGAHCVKDLSFWFEIVRIP